MNSTGMQQSSWHNVRSYNVYIEKACDVFFPPVEKEAEMFELHPISTQSCSQLSCNSQINELAEADESCVFVSGTPKVYKNHNESFEHKSQLDYSSPSSLKHHHEMTFSLTPISMKFLQGTKIFKSASMLACDPEIQREVRAWSCHPLNSLEYTLKLSEHSDKVCNFLQSPLREKEIETSSKALVHSHDKHLFSSEGHSSHSFEILGTLLHMKEQSKDQLKSDVGVREHVHFQRVHEDTVCNICKNTINRVGVIDCGHHFCKRCIETVHLNAKKIGCTPTCTICGKPFSSIHPCFGLDERITTKSKQSGSTDAQVGTQNNESLSSLFGLNEHSQGQPDKTIKTSEQLLCWNDWSDWSSWCEWYQKNYEWLDGSILIGSLAVMFICRADLMRLLQLAKSKLVQLQKSFSSLQNAL